MNELANTFLRWPEMENYVSILVIQASAMKNLHVPPFSPEIPVLIVGINSVIALAEVEAILSAVYPMGHKVKIVRDIGTEKESGEEYSLEGSYDLNETDVSISLVVPPLPKGSSFEQFQEIIAHLRAPDGCPWDREQTHLTLRKHLIEEAYETLDALDSGDPVKMAEEFGDLLLQIVLNAQIAKESDEFTLNDVIKGIHDKIIRRHPHVFGDVDVTGVEHVLQNWEKIKAAEREAGGHSNKSLLDGLPGALPALIQAQEFQSRAARVGFDWPEIEGVLAKIQEEIDEVKHANDKDELAAELGDLFFALVNLARWKKIDAESALRATNKKFKSRFSYIEMKVKENGKRLEEMSLEDLETFWQAAKKQEDSLS
jgi:tetrapyrrole methylase family protein / MazG family protein